MIAVLMALGEGVVAPTLGVVPDPLCDLDVVAHRSRAAKINLALSNAFAFGGTNAVLAVRAV